MSNSPPQSNPTPGSEPLKQFDAGDMVGALLGERYQLLTKLGESTRGALYRARDVKAQKDVAIEVLGALLSDEGVRTRFRLKAAAATSLSHTNIETPLDYGVSDEGVTYFVTEIVACESLGSLLKRQSSLPLDAFFPIFKQACTGLAYSLQRGFVHFDLQPDKILILDGQAEALKTTVSDVGLSQLVFNLGLAPTSRETIADASGLPYRSPEQLQQQKIDHRSNIYSLGCIMFQALTGSQPFPAADAAAVEMMQSSIASAAASTSDSRRTALSGMIIRMLSMEPEQRYQSFEEVLANLERIESGGAPAERPAPAAVSAQPSITTTQSLRLKEIQVHEQNWRNATLIGIVMAGIFTVGVVTALFLFNNHSRLVKPSAGQTRTSATGAAATDQQKPTLSPSQEAAARNFELLRYQGLQALLRAQDIGSGHERDLAVAEASEKLNKLPILAETAWGETPDALGALMPICEHVSDTVAYNAGDFEPLFNSYFQLAKKLKPDALDTGIAECLLARAQHMKHELPSALEHYQAGIATIEKAKGGPAVVWTEYHHLGTWYADQMDWKNALPWLQKAVTAGDTNPVKLSHDYGILLLDVASVDRHLKRFDQASAALAQAEPLVRSDAAAAQLWFDIKQEVEHKDAS